jgi:NAD(P)-dependent dehydrogenase (short-subunit alcohol dehydrogenase family)
MKTLEGKTAFITGGSTGIGLGMATVFARQKMNVVITDIREEALASAQQQLSQISDQVLALNVDSTDVDALAAAATEVEHTFGPLHVLCNNAGIPGGAKVLDTPEEGWRKTHEVNFWGPHNGIKVFLPRMLEHGEEAHIVNTASFQRYPRSWPPVRIWNQQVCRCRFKRILEERLSRYQRRCFSALSTCGGYANN